jgi:transcriptional regulator with XRE-family HTH domain
MGNNRFYILYERSEKMSFQYNKLRGRIVEICGSQAEFARRIGQSEQIITAKLSGRSSFTQDNIIAWSNVLDIDQNDIGSYFFAPKLSKT